MVIECTPSWCHEEDEHMTRVASLAHKAAFSLGLMRKGEQPPTSSPAVFGQLGDELQRYADSAGSGGIVTHISLTIALHRVVNGPLPDPKHAKMHSVGELASLVCQISRQLETLGQCKQLSHAEISSLHEFCKRLHEETSCRRWIGHV